MNIAKLIKLPLLLDLEEMRELLHLVPMELYDVQRVVSFGEEKLSKVSFLAEYGKYIEKMQKGEEAGFFPFTPALSVTEEAFLFQKVGERLLVRPKLPIVQMQAHAIDGSFRSMTFGKEAISWGVQLSYPTLFQDPTTHAIEKVDERFPNTLFFQELRRWVREKTRVASFMREGNKVNVPIRLGGKCTPWIHMHSGLKREGIVCLTSS